MGAAVHTSVTHRCRPVLQRCVTGGSCMRTVSVPLGSDTLSRAGVYAHWLLVSLVYGELHLCNTQPVFRYPPHGYLFSALFCPSRCNLPSILIFPQSVTPKRRPPSPPTAPLCPRPSLPQTSLCYSTDIDHTYPRFPSVAPFPRLTCKLRTVRSPPPASTLKSSPGATGLVTARSRRSLSWHAF